MLRTCLYVLASIVLAVSVQVWADSPPPIPDTPAGHVLAAWLDVFNSGERARIEGFLSSHRWESALDQQMLLREMSGGVDLITIEKSERTRIVFRLKDKIDPAQAFGKIEIKQAAQPVITLFSIYEAPPGEAYPDYLLDAAKRARIVEASRSFVDKFYVYPEIGRKMSDALQSHLKRGDYDAIADGEVFSERITEDLRAICQDKHLSLDFYLFPQPEPQPASKAKEDENIRKEQARENCGFERAEHLPPNIGYLKFNSFSWPDICGATAVAAMNFLGDSDAIIFDIRENGGGTPRMVALIETYLFDKATHLNDFYLRTENETDQSWTLPYVPGKRFTGKPVYVLISKNTFSAAEQFAYDLQNLKRATLIGETSAGGAHTMGPHRIDEHFTLIVPFARAINPVSKTNWEGKGVEPDVKLPADESLKKAIEMATQDISGSKGKP